MNYAISSRIRTQHSYSEDFLCSLFRHVVTCRGHLLIPLIHLISPLSPSSSQMRRRCSVHNLFGDGFHLQKRTTQQNISQQGSRRFSNTCTAGQQEFYATLSFLSELRKTKVITESMRSYHVTIHRGTPEIALIAWRGDKTLQSRLAMSRSGSLLDGCS